MKASLIARREIRSHLSDVADLAFGLALPVLLTLLILAVFGTPDFFPTAHLVDADGGDAAWAFRGRLADRAQLEILDADEAHRLLERSAIHHVLWIPEGFGAALASGEGAGLRILRRGSGSLEGQVVSAIAHAVLSELAVEADAYRRVRIFADNLGIEPGTVDIDARTDAFLEREAAAPLVGVTTRTVGAVPDMALRTVAGILSMFLLFTVTLGAAGIVEERRSGIVERMKTVGVRPWDLFGGKMAAGIFKGMLQAGIMLALLALLDSPPPAVRLLGALGFSILALLTFGILGLLLGGLARTREQALWAAILFTMISSVSGGTFFEISASPTTAAIARVSPVYYAIQGLQAILEGGGWSAVATPLGLLLGILGILGPTAFWVFRRAWERGLE